MSHELSKITGLVQQVEQTIDRIINFAGEPQDPASLPPVFLEVNQRLPHVRGVLQMVAGRIQQRGLAAQDIPAVVRHLTHCKDEAERLEGMFELVLPPADGPTRSRLYRDAVRSFGNGESLETVTIGLLHSLADLARNQSIELPNEQTELLDHAIQELSALPPSVPPDIASGGLSFINTGPGDQTVYHHTGSGEQNNNNGSGSLYVAKTMHFGGNM